MSREQRLADTFVLLADTFKDAFDVIDFLDQLCERCVELLEISAAAVLLGPPGTGLHTAAPCTPHPQLAELLATGEREGPAVECFRTSTALTTVEVATTAERWPAFTPHATAAGYAFVSALPLRLRHETIGCLLLCTTGRPVPEHDVRLAQALADAATIGILHEQTLRTSQTITTQLSTALHSRITIEQAKGMLAARADISVDDAFHRMRAHARTHNRLLTDIAARVIDNGFTPDPPPARRRRAGGADS